MIGSALAPTGPLHPGLFVLGLLAGAAGGLVARALGARHAPSRPATALLVASGLGAAVLVGDGLAPTPLVAALVVALGAGALVGERPLVVRVALTASVCALVATAVASPSGPLWLLVVLLGALLLTVVSDPPPPTTVCPWLVSGFAALGIWAGAPDTEVALVAGALLAGSILTADPPWASARRAPGLNPWPAVCVLLTWGAAWGYRARPGGSGGAVIALVAVFAWLAVERRGGPARPRAGVAGALVATAAIIALGARTVGLDRSLGTRPALTVALAAAVAVAAMLTGASRRPPLSGPATGGTPPT